MLPRYIREMRRCNINASHEIFVAILPFISLARTVHYTGGRGRLQQGRREWRDRRGLREKDEGKRERGKYGRGGEEGMITPVGRLVAR